MYRIPSRLWFTLVRNPAMPGFSCQARSNRSGSSRGTGSRSRVRLIVVLSGQRRLSRYATTASTSRGAHRNAWHEVPGFTPCGSRIHRDRADGVLGSSPAAMVARLPNAVRFGPNVPWAVVPLIV